MEIRKLDFSLWKTIASKWIEFTSKETRGKIDSVTTEGVSGSHATLSAQGTESKIRSAKDFIMSDDEDDD